MYHYHPIPDNISGAEAATTKPVTRYGIGVYVDTDPDWCGSDFWIDPTDEKGIELFREFAKNMAAHYKSLNQEA